MKLIACSLILHIFAWTFFVSQSSKLGLILLRSKFGPISWTAHNAIEIWPLTLCNHNRFAHSCFFSNKRRELCTIRSVITRRLSGKKRFSWNQENMANFLIVLVLLNSSIFMVLNGTIITKSTNQNDIEGDTKLASSNCPTYPSFCEIKTEVPLERLCFEVCHNARSNHNTWRIQFKLIY